MSRFRVHLSRDKGDPPERGIYAKGTAFKQGAQLRAHDLKEYFQNVDTPEQLKSALVDLNGFYSVVGVGPHFCFAAVDRLRSLPLFYGTAAGALYLSDDAEWVRRQVGDEQRDPAAAQEFLLTGYVTGSDTLFPNVKQLQAGEYLFASVNSERLDLHTSQYFRFTRQDAPQALVSPLEELHQVTVASIDRLIEWADGRAIVLPLSGGYDSRIIAALLKQASYPSIIAFTYGHIDDSEAQVSQQVASSLGLEWHFVPYANEKWRDWFDTEERERYFRRAHQHASVPHIQDWPAVWMLKQSEAIPKESVFVPGHSGDFVAGSHTLMQFVGANRVSAAQAADVIRERHYSLWRSSAKRVRDASTKRVVERIGIELDATLTGREAINLHDAWNWQERQAKFIVNSLRVYEFWGYDWWMPLWDAEMMAFWERVPLAYRLDTSLWRAYVNQQYAAATGTPVAAPRATRSTGPVERLKATIRTGPIAPLLREARRSLRRLSEYRSHPLSWYGILDEDTFRSLYTGRENINSFIGKMVLESEHYEPMTRPTDGND